MRSIIIALSLVATITAILPASAQQQSNREVQHGVVVLRGSGPAPTAATPALASAAATEAAKTTNKPSPIMVPDQVRSSYCAVFLRSKDLRTKNAAFCDDQPEAAGTP